MTKSYKELIGNFGKMISFRPERFHYTDLFRDVQPIVKINSQIFIVRNISISGLLIVSLENGFNFAVGETVHFQVFIGEYNGFKDYWISFQTI